MPDSCPLRGELIDWSLGRVPAKRGAEIEQHLGSCPGCVRVVEGVDDRTDPLLARARRRGPRSTLYDELGCKEFVKSVAALGPGLSGSPTVDHDPAPGDRAFSLAPGSHFGVYEILEQIGRGGIGTVYRARHPLLGRDVALKVLKSERIGDPRVVSRFLKEIQTLGNLHHPGIVQATDAGIEDDQPYLVMELVRGLNLEQVVRRRGALSVPDACEVARQVAGVLDYTAGLNLVHRDIKPSNLMIADDGVVRVMDLGLSLAHVNTDGEQLTETGFMLGTPDYMAPEQAVDPHNVDFRADLYALGCTLYFLLAGRAPFASDRRDRMLSTVLAHQGETAVRLRKVRPGVPRKLEEIVARLMNKNPADRFATAGELANALAPFAAGAEPGSLVVDQAPSVASRLAADKPDPLRSDWVTLLARDLSRPQLGDMSWVRPLAATVFIMACACFALVLWSTWVPTVATPEGLFLGRPLSKSDTAAPRVHPPTTYVLAILDPKDLDLNAVDRFLGRLRPDDRLAVVCLVDGRPIWALGPDHVVLPADGENRKKVVRILGNLFEKSASPRHDLRAVLSELERLAPAAPPSRVLVVASPRDHQVLGETRSLLKFDLIDGRTWPDPATPSR